MIHLFEYRAGSSLLHRLDPRAKLLLLCVFSAATAAAGWAGAGLFLAVLLLGLFRAGRYQAGLSPLALLRSLRLFLFFLFLIILVRGCTSEPPALAGLAGIGLSGPGLMDGGLVALRFFNIMLMGLLFAATTRPSDLNWALQKLAAPLPMVPEKRLGMIFSLALRFLPLILAQARDARDAVVLRGGNLQKNPIRQITRLALALMTRTIRSADTTALAMEARCYTEERTLLPVAPSGREIQAVAAGLCLALVILCI